MKRLLPAPWLSLALWLLWLVLNLSVSPGNLLLGALLPDSGHHCRVHVLHAADAGRCRRQGWTHELRQEQGAPAL